jgi:UDP-glucose 4-epimerase
MKKALITGGAGYIGHHLQKELKKNGYEVIIMDKKHPSKMMSRKYYDRYIQTDISDYKDITGEIRMEGMFAEKELEFDIVFHLAGLIEVAESQREPISYYENNVVGTINILKLMKEYKCDKIVFSSSAGVYDEDGDVNPKSVYGRTKFLSEEILFDAEKEGIRCVSLRYFNVAGADIDSEFGENHSPETHLIPNILNNEEFTIYGTDYPTWDGTCVRDYIHVTDLAVAHIKAAERLYDGKTSSVFNIGSGTGYSVKDVLSTVEILTGKKINTKYADRRPGDPAFLKCDTEAAEIILNFKPQYGLKDIINTAYRWEVTMKRKPL